jgi:hypothetical protein
LQVAGLVIDSRFNGPPDSGNGGYTCGLLAREIEGPAEVTLRKPPPLGVELSVDRVDGGVRLVDGDTLVAEAAPARADRFVDPPAPVDAGEARAALGESFFTGPAHPFPTCFVCGPRREAGDGLRIFPSPIQGRDLFAAVWAPDESVAVDGCVPPEIVWSALDCPTSAPGMNQPGPDGTVLPIVLARLAVDVCGTVEEGAEHVVTSWEIGRDGRKREAGAALVAPGGDLVAQARALWIELRPS